jgi:LDH2 family malate/lactate/ureidoglycolate dehydrogenase
VAEYPGAERERRFAFETVSSVVGDIFRACGMSGPDATLLADSLAQADLRGIHSHGVMRVPDYVEKLLGGGVDPAGRPRLVRERAGALVVDGGNSMGQIGAAFAMRAAIERARTTGVAFAAVGGSNHCGALDYWVRMAIAENMIGLAATNALPTMAPWGGTDKIVGLNPIGIGIPAGEEPPFVLDVALGATAHGKMRIYKQKGEPIPEGWAFDEQGRPTTDVDRALAGLIQPIGQHKGIGLAMAMGILSTLLSGAGYGTESGNMVDGAVAGADGHWFAAIDVAAFEEPDRFRARMDEVVRQYHASPAAPGFTRTWVPGHLEAAIEARHRREGIPLNEETISGIVQAAGRVGASAAPLASPSD